MPAAKPPTSKGSALASRLDGVFWLALLAAHAVAAALWWWLMPQAFPLSSARFFMNGVVPWAIIGIVLAVPLVRGRRAQAFRSSLLAVIPLIWISGAVSARIVFPVTMRAVWIAPLFAGAIALGLWSLRHRTHWRLALKTTLLPALALGSSLVVSQRAPTATTHPTLVTPSSPSVTNRDARTDPTLRMKGAQVGTNEGTIQVTSGAVTLTLAPMLAFHSRSPDGCWTLLARLADRVGPHWVTTTVESSDRRVRIGYLGGDEVHVLEVATDDGSIFRVDSTSSLPRTVWSHLNSFTELTIIGHRRLFVAFSPAADARFEVMPMDYPVGRPVRFAYLDGHGTFHIAEAHSAEKGPFTDLAVGRLARGDPMTVTLFDEETPKFRLTFDDFTAQASTELSPTAGWGVTQNALQFALSGDAPGAMASVFFTLASTSVGRGFDSVGHAPGVYRNRIRVERL